VTVYPDPLDRLVGNLRDRGPVPLRPRRIWNSGLTGPIEGLEPAAIGAGGWDPSAFVDACRDGGEDDLLRAVQLAEIETLVRFCFDRAVA
jgi:hypothetical protein